MDATFWVTTAVFLFTYLGLALGRVPGLRTDRAGVALVGATLMLATGMLTLRQAVDPDCIDYETLALLFGMMVVVGFLRLSGALAHLTRWCLARIRSPRGLLAVTVGLSGVLSAFLVNDVICVALTPLVLRLARKLGFDPVPHLVGLATAANVGSCATITGNPQNMIIGVHARIGYLRFAAKLGPVALAGLVLDFLLLAWVYRRSLAASPPRAGAFRRGEGSGEVLPSSKAHTWLQRKSVAVTLIAVVLFCVLGSDRLALVALGAASVLLLGRVKPEKVYRQVDWGLLVMFAGLFVVVYAFRLHVVSRWGVERWTWLTGRPVELLSLVSAGLSNLVSNVPAVLLLEPVVHAVPGPGRETAWLALAMSSTLAGNLTVLGSVANLIVVENARREGVAVSFAEYSKVGVPLTVLTLLLGVGWLRWAGY